MNRMVSKGGPVIAKLDLIVDSYSKEVRGRKFNSTEKLHEYLKFLYQVNYLCMVTLGGMICLQRPLEFL